jgi:hypothetical protein
MRTSSGSSSVVKIIQKRAARKGSGNRRWHRPPSSKCDLANGESETEDERIHEHDKPVDFLGKPARTRTEPSRTSPKTCPGGELDALLVDRQRIMGAGHGTQGRQA